MEKKTMPFVVTECLGGGDGGDIKIEVEVTATDIEQMKELVREQEGDEDYFPDYCPALYERIKVELMDEDDGDEVFYKVQVPDEIYEAVDRE